MGDNHANADDHYSPANVKSTLLPTMTSRRLHQVRHCAVRWPWTRTPWPSLTTVNGEDKYGVAIGYDKMSNVDKNTAFVAQTTKANLTDVVLFDA